MKLIEAFLHSLKLPSKKAMFKLNRISMDLVVFYLFILLFIVSIPALIEQIQVTDGFIGELHIILKLIYFFMFYYLPLTISLFIFITILAYVGTGISKILKRKLRLQIIWKLLAFTTTTPFLTFAMLSLIYPISDKYLFLAAVYSLILLVLMILKYPKRRVRKKE